MEREKKKNWEESYKELTILSKEQISSLGVPKNQLWYLLIEHDAIGPYYEDDLRQFIIEHPDFPISTHAANLEDKKWQAIFKIPRLHISSEEAHEQAKNQNTLDFFLMIKGQKQGPFTYRDIMEKLAHGDILFTDLFSSQLDPNWQKIHNYPPFNRRVRKHPPKLPKEPILIDPEREDLSQNENVSETPPINESIKEKPKLQIVPPPTDEKVKATLPSTSTKQEDEVKIIETKEKKNKKNLLNFFKLSKSKKKKNALANEINEADRLPKNLEANKSVSTTNRANSQWSFLQRFVFVVLPLFLLVLSGGFFLYLGQRELHQVVQRDETSPASSMTDKKSNTKINKNRMPATDLEKASKSSPKITPKVVKKKKEGAISYPTKLKKIFIPTQSSFSEYEEEYLEQELVDEVVPVDDYPDDYSEQAEVDKATNDSYKVENYPEDLNFEDQDLIKDIPMPEEKNMDTDMEEGLDSPQDYPEQESY